MSVDNPLKSYPNRGWERIYRDLYATIRRSLLRALRTTRTTASCAPTFVPEPSFASVRRSIWRGGGSHRNEVVASLGSALLSKGLALVRRFYGDRRCRYPLVRKGWLQWQKDGFPRDPATGKVDPKYLQRGKEPFVRVSWDEAFDLVAKGMHNVAASYSAASRAEVAACAGLRSAHGRSDA